jgi:hypothetical protein
MDEKLHTTFYPITIEKNLDNDDFTASRNGIKGIGETPQEALQELFSCENRSNILNNSYVCAFIRLFVKYTDEKTPVIRTIHRMLGCSLHEAKDIFDSIIEYKFYWRGLK